MGFHGFAFLNNILDLARLRIFKCEFFRRVSAAYRRLSPRKDFSFVKGSYSLPHGLTSCR